MNKLHADELLNEVKIRFNEIDLDFNFEYTKCSQLIVFGSFAYGVNNDKSDLDVLIVGDVKKIKTKKLDITGVTREKIISKSWLGSELANHISKYGIWLKGNDFWRDNTFISNASILHKKEIIMKRIISIYLRKNTINNNYLKSLFKKIFYDVYRLNYLLNNESVPPTKVIIDLIKSNDLELFNSIHQEEFLGHICYQMIEEIFNLKHTVNNDSIINFIKNSKLLED